MKITMLVAIAAAALLLNQANAQVPALALPAVPQVVTEVQATPVNGDYANYLNAVLQMQIVSKQAEAVRHANLPTALEKCSSYSGELAQGLCALAASGVLGGTAHVPAGGGNGVQNAMALAAPPQPVERPLNWWDALIKAPAALFSAAVQIAPSLFQYKVGKATVQSQERIALGHSAERTSLYAVFGGMHRDGVGAIRDTALGGFTAITQIPQGVSNVYNVDGSHAVNFGAGTLTYNPVTNSYNPITRNCNGAPGGQGGGTTVPGPGGAGGAASC